MSRYTITVTKAASRHSDPDAVIGYDQPLQTFFLQAFPDEDGDDLALWLGTEFRAFETICAPASSSAGERLRFHPDLIEHTPEVARRLLARSPASEPVNIERC
ncbi:hypothetical protein [Rhizobium mongolense]|uniref:Uncharacterized protein n=1 Tax=Rhizobium mongolense TaxID=57676 RepID=A0A7W6WHJ1_9HYPH|nr:hypothetical protein [Rhizobium mongolense]